MLFDAHHPTTPSLILGVGAFFGYGSVGRTRLLSWFDAFGLVLFQAGFWSDHKHIPDLLCADAESICLAYGLSPSGLELYQHLTAGGFCSSLKNLFCSFQSQQSSFARGEGVMDVDATSCRRRLHDQGSPFALHDRLHPARSKVEAAPGQMGVDKLRTRETATTPIGIRQAPGESVGG